MFKLLERNLQEGWGHHQRDPVRVYENDPVQNDRIKRTQDLLQGIVDMGKDANITRLAILELGCGTGDISGPFSGEHRVVGIDCALQQIQKARERFPGGDWLLGPAEYYQSGTWDVIVLCEFLEHVLEPEKMVRNWLPHGEFAIISHPIDEPQGSELSGGDHCWSYSEEDFKNWFELGGHKLVSYIVFQMGAYRIALGWSRKKKKENGQ
jgi:SAM-dependent methyltransferase